MEELFASTAIDPWFLAQLKQLIDMEADIASMKLESIDAQTMRGIKRKGFSDRRIAKAVAVQRKRCASKTNCLECSSYI